jgi:hypothetical protein
MAVFSLNPRESPLLKPAAYSASAVGLGVFQRSFGDEGDD